VNQNDAFDAAFHAAFGPVDDDNPPNTGGAKLSEPLATQIYAAFGRRAHRIVKLIKRAQIDDDYGLALAAIWGLLYAAGNDEAGLWFARLVNAFFDLEHGGLDPLLAPKKVSNRAPGATALWRARAQVAASLDLLVTQLGMAREAAARQIARDCPELRHLAPVGAQLDRAMMAWRAEFKKKRIKNRSASSFYNYIVNFVWIEDDLKGWVGWNLGEAMRSAQHMASRKD
jgi:hypothetical protein